MGKPRLIIIIRHAQSEGNKDKAIHQKTPDHRVGLTEEGLAQARAAGSKLRALLRPDDNLHFFISPYKRTRQTTEGILESLCSDDPDPSSFQRHHIRVYEEPRLREQDFGNFQPGSAETERLWKERADYGHFFYRIPNGESGADVYDRVSSFNGSLWRRFNEDQMASVAVLVTHGLCSRVFLMAWYHYSVEFFEDLRNINHCEFLVMKLGSDGKYVLQNELRRWSDLKRERMARNSISQNTASLPPHIPVHRWNRSHGVSDQTVEPPPPVRNPPRRQNTADLFSDESPASSKSGHTHEKSGSLIHATDRRSGSAKDQAIQTEERHDNAEQNRHDTAVPAQSILTKSVQAMNLNNGAPAARKTFKDVAHFGRDGGGSKSGAASPFDLSDEECPNGHHSTLKPTTRSYPGGARVKGGEGSVNIPTERPNSLARALRGDFGDPGIVLADALGDRSDAEVDEEDKLMGTEARTEQESRQILADELAERAEEKSKRAS